jgi:ATP:corrinoid adenosyltransferase
MPFLAPYPVKNREHRCNSSGKPYFIALEERRNDRSDIDAQDVIFSPKGNPPPRYVDTMKKEIDFIGEVTHHYDIIVRDEIILPLYFGLLSLDDVFPLLGKTVKNQDAVLTGRNA